MFKPSLKIAGIALGIAIGLGALSSAQAAGFDGRGHDTRNSERNFGHQHNNPHQQQHRHHHQKQHYSHHSQHSQHGR